MRNKKIDKVTPFSSDPSNIESLEVSLGYVFRNKQLLYRALTHRSFVNERGDLYGGDNQRLEFLGDAVLGLVISSYLYNIFPDMNEGELSVCRSSMVSKWPLVAMARRLGVGDLLRLGKGEDESGGRDKDSVLEDAIEAIIGAVFLDSSYAWAVKVVLFLIKDVNLIAESHLWVDYKGKLQEVVNRQYKMQPVYCLIEEAGEPHSPTFICEVRINGDKRYSASGKTKKEAENLAAKKALKFIAL